MCVGGGGVFEYVCVGVSVSLNEWVWMFLFVSGCVCIWSIKMLAYRRCTQIDSHCLAIHTELFAFAEGCKYQLLWESVWFMCGWCAD